MWRPLRPSVKRQLRQLQRGEVRTIVVGFGWEFDEVDRRMRRLELTRSNPETEAPLAEVVPISRFMKREVQAERQLRVVGSDVDPGSNEVAPGLRRPLGMRHTVPNALNDLPRATPKTEFEQPADVSHLAELLEFVLWLVGEYGILEVSELTQYICYQFEIGTYSDREIGSVLEVVLSDNKERGSN